MKRDLSKTTFTAGFDIGLLAGIVIGFVAGLMLGAGPLLG